MSRLERLRLLVGAAQLLLALWPAGGWWRHPAPRHRHLVAGTVGVRRVGQAVLLKDRGSPTAHRLSAGVDALHAASMGAVAVALPHQRKAALLSVVVSALFGTASWSAARRAERTSPG